jgi:hypothetical protein
VAEQGTHKPLVVGSSPIAATIACLFIPATGCEIHPFRPEAFFMQEASSNQTRILSHPLQRGTARNFTCIVAKMRYNKPTFGA